jgi:hypothetical protein
MKEQQQQNNSYFHDYDTHLKLHDYNKQTVHSVITCQGTATIIPTWLDSRVQYPPILSSFIIVVIYN